MKMTAPRGKGTKAAREAANKDRFVPSVKIISKRRKSYRRRTWPSARL
jgi:hypothetical protein